MTTLLVASNGGHLAQLVALAARFEGAREDRLWVTFAGEQARTLLDGERVVFIPYIGARDLAGVWRSLVNHARRLIALPDRVTAAVSTGSAIAMSFLPYAAAKGIPAHYIESAARVTRPSLTGRLMQWVPRVRLYRQYPEAAQGRWHYAGSVFDGFSVVPAPARAIQRVVVTVGSDLGFPRLLRAVAPLIPPGADVLWQTAEAAPNDMKIDATPYLAAAALDEAIQAADVVICHAGCGSALTALAAGRLPVLIPRDPRHREVVDDHQIEIGHWLAQRGLAVTCAVDALTVSHLEAAAAHAVVRRTPLPPFRLTPPAP